MRLEGKVALVAGGGMGIGRACALLFAQEGARIVLADIDETAGQQTALEIQASGGDAYFNPADVTIREQVQRLVEASSSALRKAGYPALHGGCIHARPVGRPGRAGLGPRHAGER